MRVPALEDSGAIAIARIVGADGVPFRSLSWFGDVAAESRLSSGRVEVDRLPPGEWTVEIRSADGRTWFDRAITSPAAPAEVVQE